MAFFDTFPSRYALVILGVLAAVSAISGVFSKPKTNYRYPPGPKGIPVFGNLFQIPPRYPGAKLVEWGKQYGDL